MTRGPSPPQTTLGSPRVRWARVGRSGVVPYKTDYWATYVHRVFETTQAHDRPWVPPGVVPTVETDAFPPSLAPVARPADLGPP